MKARAERLERALDQWKLEVAKHDRADRELEQAKEYLKEREAMLEDARRRLAAREARIEEEHALSDLKTLTALSGNAMKAGYEAALSENRARRRGLDLKEE